jgi:hypothetical protein
MAGVGVPGWQPDVYLAAIPGIRVDTILFPELKS